MQAKVSCEGEVHFVHLSGRLDVETVQPFREACLGYLADKKVVFNFSELSFVGSSGIVPFLETMQKLATTTSAGFKFCKVGSEFKKVFAASPLGSIEIYEDERVAAHAFVNPAVIPQAVEAVPVNNNEGYGFLSLTVDPNEVSDTTSNDYESDDVEDGGVDHSGGI